MFHRRKFASIIDTSQVLIARLSTISDLTNQVMTQRTSKGSLAFCCLPGYARLASLADFLFRPSPLLRWLYNLHRKWNERLCQLQSISRGDYDQLLILKIKKKTLTTSHRGKTAVSRKVVGKTRLSARVSPFMVLWVVFLSSWFPACFSILLKA